MRKIVELSQITPVTAGAPATVSCPIGNTYEKILLQLTNVTRAQLTNIELRINGNPVMTFADGDELKAINDFYGRPEADNFLTIHLARPELANIAQRRLTAIGTAKYVQTMSVHFDVAAAAVSPAVKAHAMQSKPRPLGVITMVKRFPRSDSSAGQIEIDNIPRGPRLIAVHLKKADVSDVEVELNQNKIYDASKVLAEALQGENGRTPQTAAYTHVDFCGDNDIANAVVTANASDMRFRATLDTSGATVTVVEYLERLGPAAA